MEFEDVIRKRTATRKFSSREVEEDKIKSILEAGRVAPTAKNIQPQYILVAKSNEALSKIDECSPCRYNAPVVFIVCSNKEMAFKKNDESTYIVDASIVATHMMLEATNVGLDNIWIEMFDKEKLIQKFNLGENVPICLIPIGYKSEDCPLNPLHNVRKDLSETVKYI